jgi:SAM-dependent methyltransferase
MMTNTVYDPVEDFGTLYDEVPAYAARRDVAFYVDEAARVGGDHGKVLELGCGTGRVLLPIARSGHDVMGVDASPAMLARCRARLAAEPAAVRERVRLVEADVRELNLEENVPGSAGRPGFAIAPFRILQHLLTPADQLRCLTAVHRHLADGGRFAFDVFNPNYRAIVADRSAEVEDTPERALPDGRFMRRAVRVTRVHWVDQTSEIELIYYVRRGDRVDRIVSAFRMRWYTAVEIEHLLARAGFRIAAMYGDFDRGPLRDDSPEIVLVAERANAAAMT